MSALRKRSAGPAWVAVLALVLGTMSGTSSPASPAAHVLIVKSDDLPQYQQPIDAFVAAHPGKVTTINLGGSKEDGSKQLERAAKEEQIDAVFALGAQAAGTIKVAYIDPLSGPFANTGAQGLAEFQFYADWLNAHGGVLGKENEHGLIEVREGPSRAVIDVEQSFDFVPDHDRHRHLGGDTLTFDHLRPVLREPRVGHPVCGSHSPAALEDQSAQGPASRRDENAVISVIKSVDPVAEDA